MPPSIKAAMATNSSAGCIAARIVFSINRGFDRVAGFLDLARNRMIGLDDAFGGEFLQDLEPPAAGIDLVDAFAVDRRRMHDQVLQDAPGADAGFERHILGRRGRCLADIGRGKNELAEGDIADFAASGHGGDSCDGRARAVSRPGKPVTNPLSALFLWGTRLGPPPGRMTQGRAPRLGRSPKRRVAAVVTGADGGVVFGAVDVSDAVGDRDDQGGLGRILPLAARRPAKMGGAAPEQSVA